MKPNDTHKTEANGGPEDSAAVKLIRSKLHRLYGGEPDTEKEVAEAEATPEATLSKHKKYMQELGGSGRSQVEIQTAWHEYYAALPDKEKHEVWQEFYSEHARLKQKDSTNAVKREKGGTESAEGTEAESEADEGNAKTESQTVKHPPVPVSNNTAEQRKHKKPKPTKTSDLHSVDNLKKELIGQIRSRSGLLQNPHVRSMFFGIGMGGLTLLVMLFGFFNERFVSPFIRPNSHVSATPIIVDPDSNAAAGPESKIILPKINVEAPVVYDVPSIAEKDVQKGLENGVVHYITTPNPGEKGNSVIFGHSSSNIINKGKYKFAFILLKSLEKGDTFIVQKDGKRYVYKIYNKFVTSPKDLSVLGPTERPAVMTLITCDPPGTSTNRLIIQAEQIFPDPASNTDSKAGPAPSAQTATTTPEQLPSNSVTLWRRIVNIF